MTAHFTDPNEAALVEQFIAEDAARRDRKLQENQEQIDSFVSYAATKGINLKQEDFTYIPSIGIIATHDNLLLKLNPTLQIDKEGLVYPEAISRLFDVKGNVPGYLFSERYMAMLHPYFRRKFSNTANYAPSLIDEIWPEFLSSAAPGIALDLDRIRIDVSDRIYMEFDTWYGAPFTKAVASIPDGVVKICPPLDLSQNIRDFFFQHVYALDVKWSTSPGIRNFYIEEMFTESLVIPTTGFDCYPARYIHSEYDVTRGVFRHLDGAVHLYSRKDYLSRRDLSLDFGEKTNQSIKPPSKKLFKYNREISVDKWIEYCCHFCSGNPLIHEYFSGKLADNILLAIEKLRAN